MYQSKHREESLREERQCFCITDSDCLMPYSWFSIFLVGHVVNTFLWEMGNREPDLPLHFHRDLFCHQVSTCRALSGQTFSRWFKSPDE